MSSLPLAIATPHFSPNPYRHTLRMSIAQQNALASCAGISIMRPPTTKMEEKMAQDNAARADEESSAESFSNKTVVMADNGHGAKVKLWTNKSDKGEFHTVSIELS